MLAAPACSGADGPEPSGGSGGDAGLDATVDVAAQSDANAPEDGATDSGSAGLGFLSLNLHCFVATGSAYADDAERYEAIAQGIASTLERPVPLRARPVVHRDVCSDCAVDPAERGVLRQSGAGQRRAVRGVS